MGCDIHFSVEKKAGDVWTKLPNPLRTCWACDGTGKNENAKEPREVYDYKWNEATQTEEKYNIQVLPAGTCSRCRGTGKATQEFYDGRNYTLFSVLAGVRDYGKVKPISPPRGMPDDLSTEVADEYEGWGGDAHSASWYSLDELINWNWDEPAGYCSGIVGIEQFKEYLKTKKPPDSYCQGIGGPNIVVADPAWLADQIMQEELAASQGKDSGKFLKPGVNYHVRLGWGQTYRELAGEHFLKVVEELRGIADEEKLPYDRVRICFYFDN